VRAVECSWNRHDDWKCHWSVSVFYIAYCYLFSHPLFSSLRWKIDANITYLYPKDTYSNGDPKCESESRYTVEGPWIYSLNINLVDELAKSTTSEYVGTGKKFTVKLQDPSLKYDVKESGSAKGLHPDICRVLAVGAASWLFFFLS
jgi:hypothetical protein